MKNTVNEMLKQITWKMENAMVNKEQKLQEILRLASATGHDVGSAITQIAKQITEVEVEIRLLNEQKTMWEHLLISDRTNALGEGE